MYVWYICTHCVYGVEWVCMHMLYVSMCVCLLVVLTQTQSTAFVSLLLLGLQVCVLPYGFWGSHSGPCFCSKYYKDCTISWP